MLTIATYFLCHVSLLKYEEGQNYEDNISLRHQPAEEETLNYNACRTSSVPLKSEKTEELYQDYNPGMLTYIFFYGVGKKFS